MVLRVEYILLVSLAIVFGFIVTEPPNNIKAIESNSSKEIVFKNFSLIELTPQGIENHLSASLAIKYKEYFEFKDINLSYKNSYDLLAKKAVYDINLKSISADDINATIVFK